MMRGVVVLLAAMTLALSAGLALHAQQAPVPAKPIPMVGVPLPSDAQIQAPIQGTLPEEAAFSGEWFGKWDDDLPHILIVEEIQTNHQAVVVYAWGTGQRYKYKPGWTRHRGIFANGELQLPRFSNGAVAAYRMRADGTLDGTYTFTGGVSRVVMKHIDIQK